MCSRQAFNKSQRKSYKKSNPWFSLFRYQKEWRPEKKVSKSWRGTLLLLYFKSSLLSYLGISLVFFCSFSLAFSFTRLVFLFALPPYVFFSLPSKVRNWMPVGFKNYSFDLTFLSERQFSSFQPKFTTLGSMAKKEAKKKLVKEREIFPTRSHHMRLFI